MEQRKLIKLGNSSFAIALPKRWIDKSGLKKGENVFLEENGNGELTIQSGPGERANNKKVAINSSGKSVDNLRREIRAAYINGYTHFEINNVEDKQTKNNIKKILDNFLSFELIDSNEGKIIARDFFSLEDTNLTNFIKRMDNNVKEIFEIALEELKKGKISPQKIKEVEEIDKDINKFYFLCSRTFMRGIENPSVLTALKTSSLKLFNDWWFSFNIESLSDNIKYLLKDISKEQIEQISEILPLAEELYANYLKCMEAFYKGDASLAIQAIESNKKIENDLEKIEKKDSNLSKIFYDIKQIRKQIYQNAKIISYSRY